MMPVPTSRGVASAGCRSALVVAVLLSVCGSSPANEVVVKNDSITDGSTATIQAGFVAGESAAAWLTSPCNGNIVAVQVYWRSLTGGTPLSLEESITIFSAGSFPVPGTTLAFLEGPVMTDGVLNEFRYLDENNTIPISVPVTQGQVFVVSFRFANTPSPSNGPSVVTDNGCQAGKNAIDAQGLGWVSSCALGVHGDFMIRAVVDCAASTGACCLPSGTCVPNQTTAQCNSQGGTYQGDNSDCGSVNCPVLIGACCLPDTTCLGSLTSAQCTGQGGTYQGNGSNCGSVNCPLLLGACCLADGSCVNGKTSSQCTGLGGAYQGNGSDCGSVNCPQPPQACCNPGNGFCAMLSPTDCTNFGAVPQGPGTACTGPQANQCPKGACCMPNGSCVPDQIRSNCTGAGGVYQGDGVLCSQVSCPQPQGACCLTSGGCSVSGQSVCEGFGNSWKGAGTNCADNNGNGTADVCEPPCTQADGNMNGDAAVDGKDVGRFTAAMLGTPTASEICHGDFNGNQALDVGDIDGMTNALLAAP